LSILGVSLAGILDGTLVYLVLAVTSAAINWLRRHLFQWKQRGPSEVIDTRLADSLGILVGLVRRCERCGALYQIKTGHRKDVCDWIKEAVDALKASRNSPE
jgi:hypothetical protein